MRIEEYLHAAMVGNRRSDQVPVVECGGTTDEPGNAQTSPAPAEPTRGERR